MKVPKKFWWLGGLVAFVIAAQIGSTPRRSDDLRVALMSRCPVSTGALESGGVAVEIAAAVADAATGAALKTAAQVAKAYGQAQASTPRAGATAEHFHLLSGRGEVLVNKQIWSCLVIAVKDLRATDAAPTDGASDPFSRDRVFLEARIAHAADGSAFELQPVTLRFRRSADASLLGSAARDLQFDIAFSTPGAKDPFARAVLDFPSVVPTADMQWSVDRLGTELAKRSGWLPAPPVHSSLAARAQELKALKPGGEPRRTSVHSPTTVQVSLVERRDASVLWKYLGELLDSLSSSPQKPGS